MAADSETPAVLFGRKRQDSRRVRFRHGRLLLRLRLLYLGRESQDFRSLWFKRKRLWLRVRRRQYWLLRIKSTRG